MHNRLIFLYRYEGAKPKICEVEAVFGRIGLVGGG
jgi:hypothetical protein